MKKSIQLALLSAFLLWLAWPPIPFSSVLLLVAFLPLLFSLESVIKGQGKNKGRKVFLLAGLTGIAWNTASIYWVFNAIHSVMPTLAAVLISLIPFGLAAVLMATAFWLYYQLRKRYSLGLSLAGLISFWISYEYLHQSWELAFPWMTLGNGMAMSHWLVQWYAYTGVFGGSIWILLSNALLFSLFSTGKLNTSRHGKRLAAAWGIVLLVPVVLSLSLYYNYEERVNPVDVVVVQPNVDPYLKYSSSPSQQLENLIELSKSVAHSNTEFFIWPETAIPQEINEEDVWESPYYHQIQEFLGEYKNGNVLTGLESYLIYDSSRTSSAVYYPQNDFYVDRFNAAMLIENGAKVQFYHKSKLVPGVEHMPFRGALDFLKPLFRLFGGTTGGYGRQTEASVFYAQSGIGTAPIICYESIWGNYVSDFSKEGAQFISIITNDGWWGNTSGKDQHLAYAKLRAIENRRWVARSANTGISGFINQKGDVVQQSKWWTRTALNQEINLNEDLTFYARTGDYLAFLCLGAGGMFLLLLLLKRRNEKEK